MKKKCVVKETFGGIGNDIGSWWHGVTYNLRHNGQEMAGALVGMIVIMVAFLGFCILVGWGIATLTSYDVSDAEDIIDVYMGMGMFVTIITGIVVASVCSFVKYIKHKVKNAIEVCK